MKPETITAAASGTFTLGGDLPVHRLGFGAMRLTGHGVWGPPADRDGSDRASCGARWSSASTSSTPPSPTAPHVSEELIAEALHPYPDGPRDRDEGRARSAGPRQVAARTAGRSACAKSSRAACAACGWSGSTSGSSTASTPRCRRTSSSARCGEFQEEGKVRHLGLSEVSVGGDRARADASSPSSPCRTGTTSPIANGKAVLDYCERESIGFIPWYPLQVGKLARTGRSRSRAQLGATPSQVALAWLLHRSPVMLPIPGTSKVAHLEENVGAAGLKLTPEQFETLARLHG